METVIVSIDRRRQSHIIKIIINNNLHICTHIIKWKKVSEKRQCFASCLHRQRRTHFSLDFVCQHKHVREGCKVVMVTAEEVISH